MHDRLQAARGGGASTGNAREEAHMPGLPRNSTIGDGSR
jgi:predicted Zn-dependent protease